VVLAVGNTLVYADTYEQALADLQAIQQGQTPTPKPSPGTQITSAPAPAQTSDARVEEIRQHLKRYRDLAAQGKWSEAGKELEAIESIARK
jgi:uncharacterized membrane protein (UPF0182 family)